jgi:hypothetical protein
VKFIPFLAGGRDDFNIHEMRAWSAALVRGKTRHRYAEFNGPHQWLPGSLAREALDFLFGRLPPKPAPYGREQRREAERALESIAMVRPGVSAVWVELAVARTINHHNKEALDAVRADPRYAKLRAQAR